MQEVPLLDYLRAIDASVDDFLDEGLHVIMESKLDDVIFMIDGKLVMSDLVESIIENGFVMPVVCWVHKDQWKQGNGNHRLAIAIALCRETIPVLFSPHHWMHEDMTDGEWSDD